MSAGRFFGRAVQRWKKAAHAIGVVQTRLLMLVIYAVVVVPTGVLLRLSVDPLRLRVREGTNWTPVRQEKHDLETARRQF